MMKIFLANKLYSSWSMRPWLVMRHFGIAFEETVIPLRQDDTRMRILRYSPSGKLPVLTDGDIAVWDSLAIIHYLAELYPEKSIWPNDQTARACALAISAEMHSGFPALRKACPMNLGKRFENRGFGTEVDSDVARITDLVVDARSRFGARGPFLFGEFSAADAMYAPVIARLDGYRFDVSNTIKPYMDAIQGLPSYQDWRSAALKEPWVIEAYEDGHTPVEVFHWP